MMPYIDENTDKELTNHMRNNPDFIEFIYQYYFNLQTLKKKIEYNNLEDFKKNNKLLTFDIFIDKELVRCTFSKSDSSYYNTYFDNIPYLDIKMMLRDLKLTKLLEV